MVLADHCEDPTDHPFLYARVISIFHANVVYTGSKPVDYRPRRMEFLWVRWYEYAYNTPDPYALPRLSFPPFSRDATGFVDPSDVIRAAHIVPVFYQGLKESREEPSRWAQTEQDWRQYYVAKYECQLAHFTALNAIQVFR